MRFDGFDGLSTMLKQKRQPKPIRWGLKKICWGLINITVPRHAPRSWIEANFQKRDCVKFIPSPKDETKCCCGQSRTTHPQIAGIEAGSPGDVWLPFKHTRPHPTDAYGTIEFQGGAHPTKAQYVRLSYDTRPELLVQLFTKEWNLELPKLLITVQGGKANFELQPKIKKEIRKGLLKAAKTTGAWIFTGGTNTGVTKQVGDALLLEGQQKTGRVVSIGIAPWGIVERNHELLGHNRDVPCHSISSPRSKLAVLNNRHAYFLLVDNGTQARYGAELILRRKLEKFISNLKLHPFTHSSTPVVCLVIEGGTNTIRAVLEYVTDTPPVPVVVCDGTGRAADLIAFVHKYAADGEEQTVLESMRDDVINIIKNTFVVEFDQAECLYQELLQCTRNKNLITVYRIQEKPEGETQELDQTILTALFKSQHLSPSEQLSLALTWNRVDIARTEIFVYGQEWPHGALDEAMMQALEHDRIDFVKLLLENGVSMKKFLTIPRLEELYNTKHGPANTLGYILRDVRPHIPKGYIYTLHDIGLVINKLMGGAYRSYYTRRKFRPIYAKVMNSYVNTYRKSSTFQRHPGANSMSLVTGLLPFTSEMALFEFPFNELLIWAVLTKRQEMSILMWAHGEEALAKSLVACKLYKAMAHEAAEDDLDTEIYDELKVYAKDFEAKGIKLLDFCYRQDGERAQRLLTCELQSWSSQSCLSLAVAANHRPLLAHSCSQVILADLWMGGLRTRKNTNLKVILGLLFPPFIKKLDFKSKEELQSMPQTEEEHLENQNLDYEDLDKAHPDAENPPKRKKSLTLKYEIGRQSSTQALLADQYPMKDTKVQENGKVSLSDSDCGQKEFLQISYDYEVKQHRPLRLKKKIYEFYTAPVTKFWADSMAYMVFLLLFTYTVLVKMAPTPSWQEVYSIAYITTIGCEKLREIISSEPVAISHKFSVWAWNMWNPCDAVAIIFFLIGLTFRFRANTMDIGRVIYCVDSIYWYLRILNILGVNKYLGPLVTMMGKMVKNMIYFVVLLLVVLLSFGVSRQAILFPNNDASWRLIREVFYQPYFMLYGEVFADDIDPACGEDPNQKNCVTGHWVTPITMSMYLLIANILLINLLIAVFNNIFIEVNAVSHQVWMFQRFTVVMEYQQKPVLPPPLIAFCHFYSLVKYLIRKAKGLDLPRDNGLKLFLEKDDMERLYDFEEECVEGYFREQEVALHQSTDERIKSTNDRVENMSQKIEDINQKENLQAATVQNIDFRIRKLEDSAEQILSTLAVIHRFMSAHTSINDNNLQGSTSNLSTEFPTRQRAISESENIVPTLLQVNSRINFLNRSLTELRPDIPHIYHDGLHYEVRNTLTTTTTTSTTTTKNPVVNDDDHGDDIVLQIPIPRSSSYNLNEEPLRIRKPSMLSEDSDIFPIEKNVKVQEQQQLQQPVPTVIQPTQQPSRPTTTTVHVTPFINLIRQGTNSTESKDTLTPQELDDDHTLVDNASDEEITEMNFDEIRKRALRRRSMGGRRNSETCDFNRMGIDMNRSQLSLNAMGMSRRQLSLTQSEPDSGNELGVAKPVINVKQNRNLLMKFHTQYTSITDELENVCQMITSPTSSHEGTEKQKQLGDNLTNAEFAALVERQHLKECEENDYVMLSKLLNDRGTSRESDDPYEPSSPEHSNRRQLRRETAVELPVTPSKSCHTQLPDQDSSCDGGAGGNSSGGGTAEITTYTVDRSTIVGATKHHCSADQANASIVRQSATPNYLIPSMSEPQPLRINQHKSHESLRKNSSTDTEYSLQPYKVIKQSSNETNTSFTGSSIDGIASTSASTTLFTMDPDNADNQQSPNLTVIENVINVFDTVPPVAISPGSGIAESTSQQSILATTTLAAAAAAAAAVGPAALSAASTTTTTTKVTTFGSVEFRHSSPTGGGHLRHHHHHRPLSTGFLKKQFSIDQFNKPTSTDSSISSSDKPLTIIQKSCLKSGTSPQSSTASSSIGGSGPSSSCPSGAAGTSGGKIQSTQSSFLQDSTTNSLSTDDSSIAGLHLDRTIPNISTTLVQDEIAKLSSNIKSSTEDEKDPPYNETMC